MEAIDDLVFNVGERDTSAAGLVPPLERDELLIGLAQLAQAMKQRKSSGEIRMKP